MNDPLHQRVREHLARPGSYPEGGPVEVVETHISVVFLTPAHAWKLLKPVKFDFLDFSTPQARREECRNEVRLNGRLAADVYLDVVPVTQTTDGLSLGGSGTPVDWVVKMRRLPADATLRAKIESGAATAEDIEHLLDLLHPFFENAARGPDIDRSGAPPVIRRILVENLDALDGGVISGPGSSKIRATHTAEVAALRSVQLQFLATHAALFQQRVDEGWVRDGHGDLRAEHVYFTDPPVIIDCVAFNDALRHADLLDEICFLATDLQRLGRDDLSAVLIDRYRRRMDDPAPSALSHFFQSYRFSVRAKVACLRAGEEAGPLRDASLANARDLLQRAVAVLRPDHVPCLIAFCGVSGSGKSTIARELAGEIGAVRLATDAIRKELHGVAIDDHSAAKPLYSKRADQRTYDALRDRARAWLSHGCTVLLDATFRRRVDRESVRRMAEESGTPFLLVECRVSEELAAARIRARNAETGDASDADVNVLRNQLAGFEPPAEVPASRRVAVSASEAASRNCGLIVSRLPVV
ncbi:MAG: AAA family ATPase [Planctomycetaceae bacterium]